MAKQLFILAILALLLASCASPTPSITVSKIAAVPPGESIVFGRVELISEGRLLELSFPVRESVWLREFVFVYILHQDRSTASLHEVTGDGFFYWHLPEGRYTITEFRWNQPRLRRISSRPVGARFEVPAEGRIVYVGTLTIRSDAGRFGVRVKDEYEQALVALTQRFPEIQKDPKKGLLIVA